MEDIVVFLGLKVINSDKFFIFSGIINTQAEKSQLRMISFPNYKHGYSSAAKAFNGTIVNRSFSSVKGESLYTTVPLKEP